MAQHDDRDRKPEWTRRGFLTRGLGALGAVGAASVLPSQAAAKCEEAVRTDSGPFYPREEIPAANDLTRREDGKGKATAKGQVLYVLGRVTDQDCKPVAGAKVEIWQADDRGNYWHPRAAAQDELDPHFRYFAYATTDDDGRYLFKTIVPSHYGFAGLERARHIHYKVKHDGHRTLTTELYFAGEGDDTRRKGDRVWGSRPSKTRHRLIVERQSPDAFADRGIEFDDGSECCEFDLQLEPEAS